MKDIIRLRLTWFLACLFSTACALSPSTVYAEIVIGGALTFDLDGDAFANGADVAYINSRGQAANPSFSYDTNQSFAEFAVHSATGNPGRPGPSPSTFASVASGWTRPNSTGLSYGFNSDMSLQTLTFDPATIATNGASGATRFTGGDSFWIANSTMYDPIADVPQSVWFHYKNLTLSYDAARIALDGANSGWLFTHNIPGSLPTYDIRNLTLDASTPGSLAMSGDLFTTPEFRNQIGIQSGLDVGSFSFSGVTAVPEPSSFALLGIAGIAGVVIRRRRQSKSAPEMG